MPDERKLKLGDSFEIDGEVWIWDQIVPGLGVKLRSESTPDRQLIMSVDEFLSHAGTAHRDSAVSLRPDGRCQVRLVRGSPSRARPSASRLEPCQPPRIAGRGKCHHPRLSLSTRRR